MTFHEMHEVLQVAFEYGKTLIYIRIPLEEKDAKRVKNVKIGPKFEGL